MIDLTVRHRLLAVVVHHSFTIRTILRGLGVAEDNVRTLRLGHQNIFVVTRCASGEVRSAEPAVH